MPYSAAMRITVTVPAVALAVCLSGCAARGPAPGDVARQPSRLIADDTLRVTAPAGPGAASSPRLYTASAGSCDPTGDFDEGSQTGSPPPRLSRGWRIARGAAIGFATGAAIGLVPWGREACLNAPRWHCAAKGGTVGAAIGIAIGAKK